MSTVLEVFLHFVRISPLSSFRRLFHFPRGVHCCVFWWGCESTTRIVFSSKGAVLAVIRPVTVVSCVFFFSMSRSNTPKSNFHPLLRGSMRFLRAGMSTAQTGPMKGGRDMRKCEGMCWRQRKIFSSSSSEEKARSG